MLLKLEQITKSYTSGKNSQRIILDKLDFEIVRGEQIAIVGPSGSGKTTLLNMIGALDRPDSGNIIFENQNISEFNDTQLAKFRSERVGFVFQLHHLLPQLSLLENVLLPVLALKKRVDIETLGRAHFLIEKMGLSAVSKQKPSELSGGECQRAAVARALINRPVLLLADEPTGALDSKSAENISDLLISLNADENVTLAVVTHSFDLAKKMDRFYKMDQGKLVLS